MVVHLLALRILAERLHVDLDPVERRHVALGEWARSQASGEIAAVLEREPGVREPGAVGALVLVEHAERQR